MPKNLDMNMDMDMSMGPFASTSESTAPGYRYNKGTNKVYSSVREVCMYLGRQPEPVVTHESSATLLRSLSWNTCIHKE